MSPVHGADSPGMAQPGAPGLHVLILPSWYVTTVNPLNGIFFKEQAQALIAAGARVGVVYCDLRGLGTLRQGALYRNRFQTAWQHQDRIPTLSYHGWAPPKLDKAKAMLWLGHGVRLVQQYVARCGRPDLVHVQSALWAGAVALAVQRRLGIPYLVTEHSSAYARGLIRPWQAMRLREVFAHAAQVLAVSGSLREAMRPYAGAASIDVLPNMVDTGFFTLPARPRPKPPFRFLTVAGLKPLKGIDVLLRAFAATFPAPGDVVLEIGGGGPQYRSLTALARELGIGDRVRFLGHASREQVREALWRAHCFVLPSFTESFGVVLIEAMATGLPVIATRCGGPEDVVSPEVGTLVEPGDVDALGAALREAHRQEVQRGREDAIRHFASERFGREAVARQLLTRYRALVDEQPEEPRMRDLSAPPHPPEVRC